MGLFNSPAKQMLKMQKNQIDVQAAQTDVGVVQQMQEQGNVAFDPQVSAMLLKDGDFFLPWKIDKENGIMYLPKKYGNFVEPGGIEPFAFLNEKNGDSEFLNEMDNVLTSILDYGEKYGIDDHVRNSFNKLARKRVRFLNNSRALEGKPQQLSKSQIIKSTGQITRLNNPNERKNKVLGLF